MVDHAEDIPVLFTKLNLENLTIENNGPNGIFLENSTSTVIQNSLIRDQRDTGNTSFFGLFLRGSIATIKDTIFRNNKTAILGEQNSRVTDGGGVVFEGNDTDTIPADLLH